MQSPSIVNNIYANMTNTPEPRVGMDATVLLWSDRKGGSIVNVFGNIVVIKCDSGQSFWFKKFKDGYREAYMHGDNIRSAKKGCGARVIFGIKENYEDPSF